MTAGRIIVTTRRRRVKRDASAAAAFRASNACGAKCSPPRPGVITSAAAATRVVSARVEKCPAPPRHAWRLRRRRAMRNTRLPPPHPERPTLRHMRRLAVPHALRHARRLGVDVEQRKDGCEGQDRCRCRHRRVAAQDTIRRYGLRSDGQDASPPPRICEGGAPAKEQVYRCNLSSHEAAQ